MRSAAREAVADLLDVDPVAARPLPGGDIGAVFLVELADGRRVVAKRPVRPGAGAPGEDPEGDRDRAERAVAAEGAGLRWIADAVPGLTPGVVAAGRGWLVLDFVPPGAPSATAAEELGRRLAALHAAGAPAFGSAPPGGPARAVVGALDMTNEPTPDWPTFYGEQRVEPYLRRAVDLGHLDVTQRAVLRQVVERLPDLAGPAEPPARLHGDLWSGNLHWTEERGRRGAALLDPAAHGGHREADLAMLRLFGTPHLDRLVGAYAEVFPLAPGWRDRVGLHQVFPLLVHAVLFGGGYGARAAEVGRAALRASRP
ncbi:fructosamine kinase family protein [Actinoalloteichus spitiensis]|uniref:fructosamine kinase family protein n=1 Tax=Actinoalloteichus spitiensis TaxID=252394 RepID=UPI000377C0FF|nr:fructosamine kinase family protein [Actinoalloteichus spitiensis]